MVALTRFCSIRYIPLGSPTRRIYPRYVVNPGPPLFYKLTRANASFSTPNTFLAQDDPQDPHPLPPRAPDDSLLKAAISQVQWLTNSTVFANNSCALCTASLQVAQFLSLAAPDQGPAFFVFLCQQFKLSSTCNTTFGATTFGPVLTQVLANADVTGYDGQVTSFVFKSRPGTPSRVPDFWADVC